MRIIFDNLDAFIDVCECCPVDHAICLDWSLYREGTHNSPPLFRKYRHGVNSFGASLRQFYLAVVSAAREGVRHLGIRSLVSQQSASVI